VRASFGSGLDRVGGQAQEEKVNFARPTTMNGGSRVLPPPTNESAAFDQFRSAGPGFDASELLAAARADAAAQRRELRDASVRVNDVKRRIDQQLAAVVQHKKAARAARGEQATDVEVLDEEEYGALQESAAAKAEYKSLYVARQEVDEFVRSADAAVQKARLDLFSSFAVWYREQFGSDPSTNSDFASPSQQARLAAQQQEARQAAAQRAEQIDEGLDPEARSFMQATRNIQNAKVRPLLNGGRRPFVGAAFK
jgi:hypothetical protein